MFLRKTVLYKLGIHLWLLLLFIGGMALPMLSQLPLLSHYNVEHGLCSSRTYFGMQDSKGYIWIGTERGVSKFDGHEFQNFTIKDGLSSNDIWGLMEDKAGRIWLNTFNDLVYIQNDKIYVVNPEGMDFGGKKIDHHIGDGYHHVMVFGPYRELWKIDENLKATIVEGKVKTNFRGFSYFSKIDSSSGFFDQYRRSNQRKENWERPVCVSGKFYNDEFGILSNLLFSDAGGKFLFSDAQDDFIKFFTKDSIFHFEENKFKVKSYNDNNDSNFKSIQRIFKMHGTENYVFIADNKYYAADSDINLVSEYDFFLDYKINNCFRDNDDNLWLCTNEGLYLLNKHAKQSKFYSLPFVSNSEVFALAKDAKERVWLGGVNGGLYYLENEMLKMAAKPTIREKSISQLEFDKDGGLFIGGYHAYYYSANLIENGALSESSELEQERELLKNVDYRKVSLSNIKDIFLGEDKFYISHDSGINVFDDVASTLKSNFRHVFGTSFALVKQPNGPLFIGQADGIFSIQDRIISAHEFQHPAFSTHINDLKFDSENYLWIATDGLGLFRFKEDKIESIKELENTLVKKIYLESEKNRIWITSNQGIHCLSNFEESPLKYDYFNFNRAHGLNSIEVNDVEVVDDLLYAATPKGLSVINIDQSLKVDNNSPVYISNISINHKDTQYLSEYRLNHDQNNLVINYVNLSFESQGNIKYIYKMDGIDEDWQTTVQRFKEYPKLPAGAYTFQLKAVNIEGEESSQQASVKFIIKAAWWNQSWFWALVMASMIGIFYLVNKLIVNRIKRQAEEENKITKKFAALELQALQAQMNPHFIFNALHAIQDFIIKKDERTANHYLVKFSRLMRLFLESTKEKVIVLEEELKLLKLYTDLEELRFENKFETEFYIDPEVTIGMVDIPSMILQPFVENAINHGLLFKESKGLLRISVEKKGMDLICAIQDNGIGREKAAEIRSKSYKGGHKSRGMGLVTERTKIFNLIERTNLQIEIKDLKDENGVGIGTRVEVSMPFHQ